MMMLCNLLQKHKHKMLPVFAALQVLHLVALMLARVLLASRFFFWMILIFVHKNVLQHSPFASDECFS